MNKDNTELRQKYYSKTYGKQIQTTTIDSTKEDTINIHTYERKYSGTTFYTLITDGISDTFLSTDKKHCNAEFLMYVPDLDDKYFEILSFLATYIAIDKPCIKSNETISSPYKWWEKLSLLQDFLITDPIIKTDINTTLNINNSDINIYWAIPITRMEREFKNKYGTNSLLDIFDEKDVSFILDKKRKSTVHDA